MSAAVLSPTGVRAARPDLRIVRLPAPARPEPHAARATSVRTSEPPLRLTTRGRVVVVLLALLLSVAVSAIAARAVADGPATGAVEVTRHVVLEGETMWALAEEVAAPGQDVRDVVLELVRLNELPNAGLMAGQEILLPLR